MDKGLGDESSSSISSSVSASLTNSNSNNSNRNMFLNQLNRNSHKIAKPIRKSLSLPNPNTDAAVPPSIIPVTDPNPNNPGLGQTPPQSQQPPVYNINKNDFRDVVQKLTGSTAHERLPPPPPLSAATHPRPPSSRLQRIRPPPLAQINNRPNQITQILPRPQNDSGNRPPISLLPPLPSVHTAAESPISAYMRFLQNSASSVMPSPLWNGVGPSIVGPRLDHPLPQPVDPLAPSHPPPFPAMPLSPLPFGCIPSPRSPYGTVSPGFMFPPTGQLGLPLSPTLPVSSPRWKGM